MNDSMESLTLPPRIYNPGFEPDVGGVIIQHSNLSLVKTVEAALGKKLFAKIEESFLQPIVKLGRRNGMNFSAKVFHFLMQRRVLTKGRDLWFTFNSQPIRFSLREFFLTTGILKFLSTCILKFEVL